MPVADHIPRILVAAAHEHIGHAPALAQNKVGFLPRAGERHRYPVQIEPLPRSIANNHQAVLAQVAQQFVLAHARLVLHCAAADHLPDGGVNLHVFQRGRIKEKA